MFLHPWLTLGVASWVNWSLSAGRLLHRPRLMAVGLSECYETWPPIGWHHHFVIAWYKFRLGLPHLLCIMGSCDLWEFVPFYRPLTAPLHSPNGRQMPAIRAVQGDCERVYTLQVACTVIHHTWSATHYMRGWAHEKWQNINSLWPEHIVFYHNHKMNLITSNKINGLPVPQPLEHCL